MKRLLFALLGCGALCATATAQDYGADRVFTLWNNATAPTSNELTGPERCPDGRHVENTTQAELFLFRADPARDKGLAVVLCPGGAYFQLAMPHEGVDMARWLAANGVTAAVLKYRMPNGHAEVPLDDVRCALRTLCASAPQGEGWDPACVGVGGSSAGGHLAAMCSNFPGDKPAFTILFYPVISSEPELAHKGSFDYLLGSDRTPEKSAQYSIDKCVSDQTPPAIMLLSDDDGAVPPMNSVLYYTALKEHGIDASMHIYPGGGHGWGIKPEFPWRAHWQQALLDWLERLPCRKSAQQK